MKSVFESLDYSNYITKQKEKTTDPVRIEKWLGQEWQIKLNGFKSIFEQYIDTFDKNGKSVCLASRTGQEVASLIELGFKDSIGIDIVPFEPYTIEGDFHNLPFDDDSVSLIYTNAVDHVKHPEIWSKEIDRVLKKDGYLLMNLQIGIQSDQYTVFYVNNVLNDLLSPYFAGYFCLKNESIPLNVHAMNWEVLLRKQ
jgi:SAM-dependent methyltransferase